MGKGFKRKFSRQKFNQANGIGERSTSTMPVSLMEHQVGITEYINAGGGFSGVFKSRYSDFQVNEIDLSGQILQLNDLSIPQSNDTTLTKPLDGSLHDKLVALIGEDVVSKIAKFASDEIRNFCFDVSNLSKEQRAKIHECIRSMYNGKVCSTTCNSTEKGDDLEKKIIRIHKKKEDRMHMKWDFPADYVHFLVHKINMDTSVVASSIAASLRLRNSQVNYCGTKDKRAMTTQLFCVKRRSPRQILNSIKDLPLVWIGNFKFSDRVLKLGDLKGNRFRIALRHLKGDRLLITEALQRVKEKGFINYYGLQRFGNCAEIPTFEVGIALLKSDYKLACELILKPRENDIPFLRPIRKYWQKNRDANKAVEMFHPGNKCIEKKILQGLSAYGINNYTNALRNLPRNLLLLYPHAFQSLIFNKILSRRLNQFGFQPIVGDLIYCDNNDDDINNQEIDFHDADIMLFDDDDVENCKTNAPSSDDKINTDIKVKRKVRTLSKEDIEDGQFTIYDIILPLPGYDVTYPDNVVGSWYNELLEQYELSSNLLKHKIKEYDLPGAYRKLLMKPWNISWEFRSYTTPQETLIISDWEALKASKNTNSVNVQVETQHQRYTENKLDALLLDFCLPPSSYATMLIRELLQNDTSAYQQVLIETNALKQATRLDNDNSMEELSTKDKLYGETLPKSSKLCSKALKNESTISDICQEYNTEEYNTDDAVNSKKRNMSEDTVILNHQ